ncbi:MAG: GH25 family lysozyme [Muribaculaceae bacterium]|nr:GH25 family lysozyme [Muribaculaceae bacterium]
MKTKKKISITLIFLFTTILLAISVYVIYRSIHRPIINIDREEYPVLGIDISAHNGSIDFTKAKSDGVSFVYIKASEGASFKDQAFDENYNKAYEAGLAIGAYHFFRFDINGTLQAMNIIKCIHGKEFQLPIAIDLEEHGNPATITPSVVKRLQDMLDYLESHNYPVIIYTNIDGYRRFVEQYFADYSLWICRFTTPTDDINWEIWQYSHNGDIKGINGDVDLDVFCGSKEEFQKWIDKSIF